MTRRTTTSTKFVSNRTGAKTQRRQYKTAAPDETSDQAKQVKGTGDKNVATMIDRTMCPDHTVKAVGRSLMDDKTTYFKRSPHQRPAGALATTGNTSGQNSPATPRLKTASCQSSFGVETVAHTRAEKTTSTTTRQLASNFVYDTDLKAGWEDDAVNGELVPHNGEDIFEVRPFVLLDFGDEKTTVDVTMFKVDGTDYTTELQILDDNEFVWWPDPLAHGTYKVYVEANDAANNKGDHTYNFEVKERAPFVLNLLAGWNSISFPANPVDRALHAVFTDPAIDQVVGWDLTEPVSPWRMATRVDGVWTTNEDFQSLTDVEGRYGYWVHSTGFITQAVALTGKGDRGSDGQPSPADIPTEEGWNFVGVVDVDGDQTQDDAGETLRNSNNDPITAAEYLGDKYTRAYTWDHINNTWDVLKKDEGMVIGTGVWVYYTKSHDIAP